MPPQSPLRAASGDHVRCDHCALPCPDEPVVDEFDGWTYRFCSDACRAVFRERGIVATVYQGFRRCKTGVSVVDEQLPAGFPRNAFVLIESATGTAEEALQAELVWRRLRKGEPVVYVAYQEPPASLIDQLVSLDWNVIPYLERGQLHVVDCFTYRVRAYERLFERLSEWTAFLYSLIGASVTRVQNPADLTSIHASIANAAEKLDMYDTGAVVVDSLEELGTLVQPVNAITFLKDLRAALCKARFVPVFAGTTAATDPAAFPASVHYLTDGIVELGLFPRASGDGFAKFLRVLKMRNVPVTPRWVPFEYEVGTGFVRADRELQAESPAAGAPAGP